MIIEGLFKLIANVINLIPFSLPQFPEKFNSAKVIFGNKPKNGKLNLNKEDFAVLEL